jgi:hypothetical protein
VVTQKRAKLWLGGFLALAVAAVILATATGAGAAASFNPQARTGFISRGDVMAAGGAGALVADPLIAYQTTQTFTETCTWTNGTSVQASGSHFLFLLFQAETRYAAGSHKITGYAISPADIVDGQTNDAGEDRALCWAARGLSDDGSTITQTYSFGPKVTTLTFFGPSGAVALPFHS